MTVTEKLFTLRDAGYAAFQSRLTPTLPPQTMIGVRVPDVRRLAKEIGNDPETERFLRAVPHDYYDENMLHAVLLSRIRDFETAIALTEAFLPYIDNWAVCDILSPAVFRRHKAELLPHIRVWAQSPHTYTCRFGLEMLMSHFLDADFDPKYLEIPASVRSEEYYVRMMIAWFFATALTKQWDSTLPYIGQRRLDAWTHRKTIQKACESYCIPDDRKAYLRSLK